jgi:hypothetical protein
MIIQPPSVLLIGPSGSGKTSAIPTQLLCGLEVFVAITEPGGVESLLDAAERLKAPIDKLHWTSCLPASAGWDALEDMIKSINSMDQKGLADVRDMGKASFRPAAMRLLNAFKNFHCERTNRDYGDITTWGDDRSFNMDSLTGWTHIGWGATVGNKPTANPGEWGIAQNFILNMLLKINTDRKCFFCLTAHPEKEMDEMSGVRKVMVSTVGAKLAPKIPTFFSEVVLCSRRIPQGFRWATIDTSADLKNRALPVSNDLAPDFAPIIAAYRKRITLAGATPPAPPAPAPAPATPASRTMPSAPMSPPPAATTKGL